MKELSHNKGFTLVELIVSIAILSILVVAFTTFFGWNITNIFENGQKSEAVAKAETKLERLYSYDKTYFSGSEYVNDPENESCEDVLKYKNRERNFCVKEVTYVDGEVKGYNVTVVVFYRDGERHVSISSFIEDVD